QQNPESGSHEKRSGGSGDAGTLDRCITRLPGFVVFRIWFSVAQGEQKHEAIGDADETEDAESEAPAESLSDISADATQRRAGVDAGDVESGRQRARWAAMIVAYQCQRRRDVACFA